jgi:general secretion pathway protein L
MASAPEFSSSRAAPPLRRKAAAFWRWWLGEIAALLPASWSILQGAAGAPLLALEGEEVVLLGPRGVVERRIAVGPWDDSRRRAAVKALLEDAGETRMRARLAVGYDEALVRRVTLPAATEENLEQVLGFEMDRLSPFRAEEVYFDYRVVSRDAQSGVIGVEFAIARRSLVDARVQQLRALGVSVQGVSLRDESGHSAPVLDLLPSQQRGARESPRERIVRYALIGAVGILFLLVLLLPIWRKRESAIALFPMLTKAKQEAEATDVVVRELERQAADYNFVLAKKHGSYPVAATLEEVSLLLPDNTWLSSMEVKTTGKTREVQLAGETPSSSKLIEVLEQSKLLQNAAPRGPQTRGAMPGVERFMIVAESRTRPQPEPRPLATLVPPSVAAQPVAPAAEPREASTLPPPPAPGSGAQPK